jgi:Lysylphosphatidylglycerol synthase TM region
VHSHFPANPLRSPRALGATGLFLAAAVVLATMPGLMGHRIGDAVSSVEDARPIWLWTAAFGFAASLLGSAWSWRSTLALCGGRLTRSDAAARYGVGSLVNSLCPVRIGEAARIALFARVLDGEDRGWRMGGVFGVITATRCLVFAVVVICGAAVGALPVWPIVLLGCLAGGAGSIAFATRNRTPHSHVAHALDAFRAIGRSPAAGARIAGWIVAATAARFTGATAIAGAIGVHSPVTAALIIVPALDLAGLLPLSGNLGITSGAVAVALQSHGVGISQALAAGLAFHAVETGAGITFGAASALLLFARRRVFVLAAAGAAACLAAAFTATVLLPLA